MTVLILSNMRHMILQLLNKVSQTSSFCRNASHNPEIIWFFFFSFNNLSLTLESSKGCWDYIIHDRISLPSWKNHFFVLIHDVSRARQSTVSEKEKSNPMLYIKYFTERWKWNGKKCDYNLCGDKIRTLIGNAKISNFWYALACYK